jgi:CHAT domain-containing protein
LLATVLLASVVRLALPSEAPATLDLDCSSEPTRVDVSDARRSLEVHVHGEAHLILEVEERGQTIESVRSDEEQWHVSVPPRYGRHFFVVYGAGTIVLRREAAKGGNAALKLSTHCGTDADDPRIAWYREAAGIAGDLRKTISKDERSRVVASLAGLDAGTPDPSAHALTRHLVAQADYMSGNTADAAQAFAIAAEAWAASKDREREMAALYGEAESLISVSAYIKVIDVGARVTSLDNAAYYAVRMAATRCLALLYLARHDDAAACYAPVLAEFRARGEAGDYANTLQPYAALQSMRGDDESAERLVRDALTQITGADLQLVRGRLEILLADLLLRRGAIAESIATSENALVDFAAAREPRWEANVNLKLAEVYATLGALDEAYASLSDAVQQFNYRDSPSRMAAAMSTLADLEFQTELPQSARMWAAAAETLYRNLGLSAEADAAQVAGLRYRLATGDISGVEAAVRNRRKSSPRSVTEWRLVEVALAIRKNDKDAATRELDALAHEDRGLRHAVARALLESDYWIAQARPDRAIEALTQKADRVRAVADATTNPILSELLAQQIAPLRRAAFDILLEHVEPGQRVVLSATDAERFVAWEHRMVPLAKSVAPNGTRADQFDRAIAEEFFAPQNRKAVAESEARRKLWALLATESGRPKSSDANISLSGAEMQSSLTEGSELLIYLAGNSRSAILTIDRNDIVMTATLGAREVRMAAATLRSDAQSLDSPVRIIENDATALSSLLFAAGSKASPPTRLFVLADEALDGIPWSLLRFPGENEALVATTSVSVLSNIGRSLREPVATGPLYLVVAAGEDESRLASLGAAGTERDAVRRTVRSRRIELAEGAAANRDTLLSAFAEPASWVHVISHGMSRPTRLGYSGIWLRDASADSMDPAFVSAFDVIERGVAAEMVVLDACALAQGDRASGGALGFATAVSRGGAEHVVAALWPVSDAASATWVPAFYEALSGVSQATPEDAVRAAQLTLRASRHFRHPFYWAGLQIFARGL